MRYFKLLFLFIAFGVLFVSFLFLQQYFYPKEKIWFIGCFLLLLYLLSYAAFLWYWSRPLEQIIETVESYQQEGKVLQWMGEGRSANPFAPIALAIHRLNEKVQRQKQQSHEKDKDMEGILDSLNEGVIACDASAKIQFANEMASKMVSISSGDMEGKSLYELGKINPFFHRCHEIVLQALQTSEPIINRWTERGIYLDLVASPLIHQTGAILVLQDKTSDYKMLELGKNFIANASHELRTPITIIRGFAEMLQNVSSLSRQKQVEIAEKIVSTCDRLDKLVKSLLTIADVENLLQKNFRSFDLTSLIENAKHLLLTLHPEAEVIFPYTEGGILVFGDGDLLELAIMNLLENAVKYSASPAHISIEIRKKKEGIEILIQDKGIGIPPVDLPHIFDRFYTVDKARSRKAGGAGLGLSIVKTIIEKHRGSVSVISKLGSGSQFTIYLPQLRH